MKSWSPPISPYDQPPKKPKKDSIIHAIYGPKPNFFQIGGGILVALAIPVLIVLFTPEGQKFRKNATSQRTSAENWEGLNHSTITSPGIPEMNHTLKNHLRNARPHTSELLGEEHNHEIYGVRNLKERLAVLQNNRHTH